MKKRYMHMTCVLSINAESDALFSLQLVSRFLELTRQHNHYWKWVVLALHNAAQGYMAMAVCGSDGVGAMRIDAKKGKERLKRFLKDREPFEPEMLSFRKLYARIQDEQYMCREGGSVFQPTTQQSKNVEMLNSLRGDLTHYFPNNFKVLPVESWVAMIEDSLEVIEFLCMKSESIVFIDEGLAIADVKKALAEIRFQISSFSRPCRTNESAEGAGMQAKDRDPDWTARIQ